MRFVPQRNMLVVASSDSTIVLYRVRDFVLLRSLKGHKGRVNAIDAHPDGRVALSVGQDRMLRMWDLVAGKSVATMKLGAGASDVISPAGLLKLTIGSQREMPSDGTRTARNSWSSATTS